MALEGLQLGHYRLERLIGSGGMGEVYLAADTHIQRQVAVKVIRGEVSSYPDSSIVQEAARLFQREARAVASLDHAHILPLFDYGEETVNGTIYTYMVMPLRKEGTLSDWLRNRGNAGLLPPEIVVDLIEQAASALQYAHNHQIIHQDVKPSNFLIRTNPEKPERPDLLLADFGIAKITSATSQVTGGMRGTPAYMAPEQWQGHPVPATDQYALAVMSYELLTGRLPFQGNMGQMMYAHMQKPPASLIPHNPQLPPEVDSVVLRALAKDPEQRFPSIAEFARALRQALPGNRTSVTSRQERDDLHATLVISADEAQQGTTRLIALPGGRKMPVSVPAGARAGQVIRLDDGPTRAVFLTIALAPPDTTLSQHTTAYEGTMGRSEQSTGRTQQAKLSLQTSSRTTNTVSPSLPTVAEPSTRATSLEVRQRRPFPSGRVLALVGLIVLVMIAGSGIFYFATHPPTQPHPTPITDTTATLPNSTPTATVAPTSTPQATSTVSVPPVTNPVPNPYDPHTGVQVLDDPLQDNSRGYKWREDSDSAGNCHFAGGAFHDTMTLPGLEYCYERALTVSDFAYQIEMTILKGSSGGIIFRGPKGDGNFYYCSIGQDGSYSIALYTNQNPSPTATLRTGSSTAIHKGLNQPNVIAIVAQGTALKLYINMKLVDTVTDTTYSSGYIGVAVHSKLDETTFEATTEITFRNAKLWKL